MIRKHCKCLAALATALEEDAAGWELECNKEGRLPGVGTAAVSSCEWGSAAFPTFAALGAPGAAIVDDGGGAAAAAAAAAAG